MTPRSPPASISDKYASQHPNEKAGDDDSEIDGNGPSQLRIEETVSPPFVRQCTEHAWPIDDNDKLDQSVPQERIKIVVGTAPLRKTFLIHKSLLCEHSEYFRIALREGNEKCFIEAEARRFQWPDDDPEEFHRWVRWIYSCSSCRLGDIYDSKHVCKGGDELDKDPYTWCAPDVEPEQAFAFGDRILSPEYCLFALACFIQHVDRADPYRVLWAYENTPQNSTLHRFVAAWLGWMKFKLHKRELGLVDEEAVEVAAAYADAFESFDGWATLDPRKYFMEHWTEPCSLELFCNCKHTRLARPFERHMVCGLRGKRTRAQRRRAMIWEASVGVWYGCCITMLVLSSYIYARDREGLIAHPSKVLGIVTACFAFVGMCGYGSFVPWVSSPTVLIGFASAVFSSHQAARCFQIATTDTSICKIQTGFATVEMVFTLLLSGILCVW